MRLLKKNHIDYWFRIMLMWLTTWYVSVNIGWSTRPRQQRGTASQAFIIGRCPTLSLFIFYHFKFARYISDLNFVIYIYDLNLIVYVYVMGMNRMLWWQWLVIPKIGIANGINGVSLVPAFQMILISYLGLDS